MNIKVLNIEYLENIEIIVDMQKKCIEQFTNNYNNNFKYFNNIYKKTV